MPEGSVQYKVRAPDGRSIIIVGFKPPTKEQLDKIFAALPPQTEIGPPESLALRTRETVPGKVGTSRGGDIELENPQFEATLQEMLSRGAPRPSGPLQAGGGDFVPRGEYRIGPRPVTPDTPLATRNQERFDENMELLGIPARMATALARGERIQETWNTLNEREKQEMGINLVSWIPQEKLVGWIAKGTGVVAQDAPKVLKIMAGMEAERRAAGVAAGTRRGTRGTAQAEEALGLDEATKNIQAFVKETGQTIRQRATQAGQDVQTWVQSQRARVAANRAAAAARAAEVPTPPEAPPLEVPEPLPTTPVEAPQTPQEATRASLWQRVTGRGGTPPVEAPAGPGGQIELTPALERAVQTRMMDRAGAEAMMRKQFPERFPKEAAPGKAKAPQTKADQLIARSRMIETLEKQVREGRISREEFMEAVAEQWPEEAARIAAQPAGRRPPQRPAAAPVTPGEAPAGATPAAAVPEAPPITEADMTADQIMVREDFVKKLEKQVKGGMSPEMARNTFRLKAEEMGWPLPPEPTGPPPVREAPPAEVPLESRPLARSPSDYRTGGPLAPTPAPVAPTPPPAAPLQAAPAPTVAAPAPAPGGPQLVRGIRADPTLNPDMEAIRAEGDAFNQTLAQLKAAGAKKAEVDAAYRAYRERVMALGGAAQPVNQPGTRIIPSNYVPEYLREPVTPEPTVVSGITAEAPPTGPVTSLKVGGRQVEADPEAIATIQTAVREKRISPSQGAASIRQLRSGVDPAEVLRGIPTEQGVGLTDVAGTRVAQEAAPVAQEVVPGGVADATGGVFADPVKQAKYNAARSDHVAKLKALRDGGASKQQIVAQQNAFKREVRKILYPEDYPEAPLGAAPEATGGVPGGEPAPTLPSPLPEAPTLPQAPMEAAPEAGMGILEEAPVVDPVVAAAEQRTLEGLRRNRELGKDLPSILRDLERGAPEAGMGIVEEAPVALRAEGALPRLGRAEGLRLGEVQPLPRTTDELYTSKEESAWGRLSTEEKEAVEAEWQDLSERVMNGDLTPEQALAEMGSHPALADVVPQRQQVLGGGLGAEPVSPLQDLERPISGRGRGGSDDEQEMGMAFGLGGPLSKLFETPQGVGAWGGASVGGLGGAMTGAEIGDTPEERTRNAIIGLIGGGVTGAGLGYAGGNEARIGGEGGKSFLGRTANMYDQYQQAAMMLGPAQWKSLFGGAASAPIRMVENFPLHPWQTLRQAGEAVTAIPQGIRDAAHVAWTGENPMFQASLNKKPAEGIASLPFRAVGVPDAFFRRINFNMTPTSDEAAKLASQGILEPDEQRAALAARWLAAGEPQTKTGRFFGNLFRGAIPEPPPNASDMLKETVETANKVGPIARGVTIPIGYTAGTNLLEQGLQRTPGINFLLQGKNNPLRVRPAQSLVNFGLGTVAVGAGALADMFLPEGYQPRAAAAAATGPYALPFGIGVGLNQYANSRDTDLWGLPNNILTSLARGTPLSGAEIDPVKFLTDVPGRLKPSIWKLFNPE